MKYFLKMRGHHLILESIFLLISLVSLFGIFIQIWFLQIEVEVDGLHAKRYLSKPLLRILNDEPIKKKHNDQWIEMVVTETGVINYPYEQAGIFIEDMIRPMGEETRTRFLSKMVSQIPDDMSIVSFTYKGEKGLCFYFNDNLPYLFKILQSPKNLIRLFLAMIVFVFMGSWMAYQMKKNLLELSRAIKRLRNLDFDTPLIIQNENELSDILKAFDEMRQEMRSHRAQGALLIMSITHDLKTPLTSLRGFLEAIKDGMIETLEDVQVVTDKMLVKTNLLEERIDEMLEFSHVLKNSSINKEALFDGKTWLKELKEYFNEESLINGINYSSSGDVSDDFFIMGNSKRLTRSIINLYDNACRYISEGDPVRFTASLNCEQSLLSLTMDDGGPGVAPENRDRIFDLFYRKDRGRNTRGMGIGLAAVKYVTETHGGSVACHNSDLGGASFVISLPVTFEK
jgi:signal transduction histidine kinase